ARVVESMGKSLDSLVKEGYDLTKLPGIGKDLSEAIKEIVLSGKFSKLEELKREIPESLIELLSIEGLGPKRIKVLYDKFGVTSLEDLAKLAESGELSKIRGFGVKLISKILEGVKLAKKSGKRFRFDIVKPYAEELREYLKNFNGVLKVEVAGSYRRKKESVGDLDILVVAKNWEEVSDYFVKYEKVKNILSKGETRSTIILRNDLQVDLRSVSKESYGTALHYFTGSKAHNIKIRKIAQDRGWKVNEYGIFNDKGEKIAGESEEEVYKSLGLSYIEPELREDRGEIEAAMRGALPKLIEQKDIRGDLHMHTTYSDGKFSIKEMALAAKEMGYSYIAITDHSKRLTVANGLDERRLKEQWREIEKISSEVDIKILKGIECDILDDGSLDLSDEVLKELDIVLVAVHYKFNLSKEEQTKRIVNALKNKYVHILAHPMGRLIGGRKALDIDMEEIFKVAKEEGKVLEINAQPQRLDLNDIYAKMAKEMGIKFAISTDSHAIECLKFMEFGINQARRGWIEREDVINTMELDEFLKFIKR
ncbi:MAG: DNA polymerase/3'-5' exonuclease PolX, partial [Epsilonproteobacteria bacterium]|nr:DNA polymerase/3'-5' exonuclease PolX [Campylobacterota bacterium]